MPVPEPRPGLGRWFDLGVSSAVLLLGAPLWFAIGGIVRLTSPGPVLYRACRVGLNGREFEMLKFRSMRVADGPAITASRDSRITGVGRLLRGSKLDEVPQLLNVLRGEMAIIGPRPEDPRFVNLDDLDQRLVLSVRPGLTSMASVEYRYEERVLAGADDVDRVYREQIQPEKLRIDAQWLLSRSRMSDIGLIARTAAAIVRPSHPSVA